MDERGGTVEKLRHGKVNELNAIGRKLPIGLLLVGTGLDPVTVLAIPLRQVLDLRFERSKVWLQEFEPAEAGGRPVRGLSILPLYDVERRKRVPEFLRMARQGQQLDVVRCV